jgi:hypothetical protein
MMFQVCTTDSLKDKLNVDIDNKLTLLEEDKGEEISVKDIN